jgi:hypothetical protein
MYVSSNWEDTSVPASDLSVMNNLIANIEPLLWKYQVNFAFWGHNHVYQRLSAILQWQVVQASSNGTEINGVQSRRYTNPQATVQLVIGNAGASFSANWLNPLQAWCERAESFWGYNLLEVHNSSMMVLTVYDTNTGNTEIVQDVLVITQNPPTEQYPTYGWELPDDPTFTKMDTSCPDCQASTSSNPNAIPTKNLYIATSVIVASSVLMCIIWYAMQKGGYRPNCGTWDKEYQQHESLPNHSIKGLGLDNDGSDISVSIDGGPGQGGASSNPLHDGILENGHMTQDNIPNP